MQLVWEIMRRLHTDAATPDCASVGISDILRAIAICYRLPEMMAQVETELGKPPGRWRRKVLRLGLVAGVTPELTPEELERIGKRGSKADLSLVVSLTRCSGTLRPVKGGAMSLLSPEERQRLEHLGQEDAQVASVLGQLRDMYDEAMARVAAEVASKAEVSLADPAAMAGLLDIFRHGMESLPASGGKRKDVAISPDGLDDVVREVDRVNSGDCIAPC